MTQQQYQTIYAWFSARPAALRALRGMNALLPALSMVSYPLLLGGLVWQRDWPGLARAALVPGAVFLGGSALRKKLNFPRPYERPGFRPLVQKATRGQAFPSRHALSAAVIASAWLRYCPPVGLALAAAALGVCIVRVLAGVHAVRDVLAGAVLGFGLGLLGMFL